MSEAQRWQFNWEVTDRQRWPSSWGRTTLLAKDFPTYRAAFQAVHDMAYMHGAMVTAIECVTWPLSRTGT